MICSRGKLLIMTEKLLFSLTVSANLQSVHLVIIDKYIMFCNCEFHSHSFQCHCRWYHPFTIIRGYLKQQGQWLTIKKCSINSLSLSFSLSLYCVCLCVCVCVCVCVCECVCMCMCLWLDTSLKGICLMVSNFLHIKCKHVGRKQCGCTLK